MQRSLGGPSAAAAGQPISLCRQSAEWGNQDRGLEAKVLELVLSERRVPFEKELVELRRPNASAGKHGVGLSAVVDLMDE
jgi:hypothetical protein